MQPNVSPGENLQQVLDKQIKDLQSKASALAEAFEESTATVSSPDGTVTVTVAPNGALRDLELGRRACELSPAKLTATIMESVRAAQRKTATGVADSFAEIVGETESTELIRTFLPPEEDEPDPDQDENRFIEEPESPSPSPPSASSSPPVGRQGSVADDEDDEDYEETSLW